MNYVIRHIEYLISRKDCVIVPGLGALLARYQCAHFDAESKTMSAPHRIFSFNPGLKHSDGSLACSIARDKDISYEAANDLLSAEVETMNRQLRLQGELSLGRIGHLIFNQETLVPEFHPYEKDSISAATAWLPTLDLNQTEKPQLRPIQEDIQIERISSFARFIRIAASITLLICLCFIASTPISIDDAALASLTPQFRQTAVQDILPAQEAEEPLYITAVTSYPQGIEMEVNDNYPLVITPTKKFCIVVASFYNMADAEKFVSTNNQPNLAIFENQGRFRVYSSSYDNETEAFQALKNYPGAWVCRLSN